MQGNFFKKSIVIRITGLALLLCGTTPAWAGVSTSVPAPSALTLLALGVAGLLLGRHGSRRPPKD